MQLKKIIGSILLSVSLISMSVVYATELSDVKSSDWYAPSVNKLVEKGTVKGYTDGAFRPNATISKAEFVTLMVRALGYEPDPTTVGHWSGGSFNKARSIGLLKNGELNIYVDSAINRYEMALMVSRGLKIKDDKIPSDFKVYQTKILDYVDIPEEYQEAVIISIATGILGGYPDKKFHGERSLSRAEAAVVIDRLLTPETRNVVEKPSSAGQIKTGETKLMEDFFTDGIPDVLSVDQVGFQYKTIELVDTAELDIKEAPPGMVLGDRYGLISSKKGEALCFIKGNQVIGTVGGYWYPDKKLMIYTPEKEMVQEADYIAVYGWDVLVLKVIENPFKKAE